MTKLIIKGDDDLKIEVFGHVYYDADKPFDFTYDLTDAASQAVTEGPLVVQVGIDGDTVSVAVSVDGFPLFQKSLSLGEDASIPFHIEFLGDTATGTISTLCRRLKGRAYAGRLV